MDPAAVERRRPARPRARVGAAARTRGGARAARARARAASAARRPGLAARAVAGRGASRASVRPAGAAAARARAGPAPVIHADGSGRTGRQRQQAAQPRDDAVCSTERAWTHPGSVPQNWATARAAIDSPWSHSCHGVPRLDIGGRTNLAEAEPATCRTSWRPRPPQKEVIFLTGSRGPLVRSAARAASCVRPPDIQRRTGHPLRPCEAVLLLNEGPDRADWAACRHKGVA